MSENFYKKIEKNKIFSLNISEEILPENEEMKKFFTLLKNNNSIKNLSIKGSKKKKKLNKIPKRFKNIKSKFKLNF